MTTEPLSDEQQIRKLIDDWATASREGDLDTVMNLMTEDVVFLTPGNPPMHRKDFAAGATAMKGTVRIEGRSDVQEITVNGDTAICWNRLEVEITPLAGGVTSKRVGNTLSVLRRGADGQWRIWRDANLLGPPK
jgi:uncharacterized protein (TIGR02246 family)